MNLQCIKNEKRSHIQYTEFVNNTNKSVKRQFLCRKKTTIKYYTIFKHIQTAIYKKPVVFI